jgi:CheY-like chemotaxis protein
MTLSLIGNRRLRSLIRRNAASFPAQVPSFSRRDRGELDGRLAQLYFVRAWSLGAIAARYGFSKSCILKMLNEWRVRAVGSGYIAEIEPGSADALMPGLTRPDAGSRQTGRERRARPRPGEFGSGPLSSPPASVSVVESARKRSAGRLQIVCHDQSVRRTLHSAFLNIGFETAEAATGGEVLALCRRIPYDAVLLDINSPGQTGIDTCRALRTLNPLLAIVILSDNSDQERNINALEAGADYFITRPYHPEEVCARIRAALRHSRAAARPPDTRLIVTQEDNFYSHTDEALVIRMSRLKVPTIGAGSRNRASSQ